MNMPGADSGPAPRLGIAENDPVRRRIERLMPGLADAIAPRARRFASRSARPRREIVHEGDMPSGLWVLRSGWAAHVRHFADGRRQIQHLLLPGDPLPLDRGGPYPATIMALNAATVIDLDGLWLGEPAGLDEMVRRHGRESIRYLLGAIARLGRQSAIERFAHLLLELRDRLLAIGMASATRFDLPLTQEMLADTLGLTSVHVNRTLQAMRQQGLIELAGRKVTLLRAEELAGLADYTSPMLPAQDIG